MPNQAEQSKFISIDNVVCDARAGFNLSLGDEEVTIGHVLKLSFPNGGKECVPDFEVQDPLNPTAATKVIGVFNCANWQGTPTADTALMFRVSDKNKALLQSTLVSKDGGAEVDVEFVLYQYDGSNKKYFKLFHTNEVANKYVIRKGTRVDIEPKACQQIPEPKNYSVSFILSPKNGSENQNYHIAFTDGAPQVVQLGVATNG